VTGPGDERPTDLDLVRARATGALPLSLEAEVERRLRTDPEFARLAAVYAVVHDATDDEVPPRPALPAPEFRPEAPAMRLLPRIAAAAALAALAVGSWVAARRAREVDALRDPVALHAIAMDAPRPDPSPADALSPSDLAFLAAYETHGAAGLRTVEGFARGLALARGADVPLLVYLHYPGCPVCAEVETGPLLDERVARAASGFLVARQDVSEAPRHLVEGLRAMPSFVVVSPEGERLDLVPSPSTADALVRVLSTEAQEAGVSARRPWSAVRDAAGFLRGARDVADPARRRALLEKAAAADPAGALGARARAEAALAAGDARAALEEARAAAEREGADAALRVLDAALARHGDTPEGRDLATVRARVAEARAFPRLAFPDAPEESR
jgi:hypothetical protein